MVRVIISLVQVSTFEKRFPIPKAKAPTIDELVHATDHNLHVVKDVFRCLDCACVVSRTSCNVRNWLRSKCCALLYNNEASLVPVPHWHVVQVRNTIVHSSHTILSLKGIVICNKCGVFGKVKCHKLAAVCIPGLTVAGARALDRMRAGLVPVPNMM